MMVITNIDGNAKQCPVVQGFGGAARHAIDDDMTKLLRDAIKQVEQLPDGEQDAAAMAMLDYLTHRRDLRVSDEDLAEIRRRRADPDRKLVSHEEARERIKRLGA
jgi:hypothetical protein